MNNNKKAIVLALAFIGSLVLFIWGYNFLKGKNIFSNERCYYAVYDDVNGLDKTNPVVVRGLRVGFVENVYFDPRFNGDIIVKMTLTSDIPVTNNTVARIVSSDIMGSKCINLLVGDSHIMAKSGDTLMSSVEAGLMQEVNSQVQPLKAKAESLISSLDSVVVVIQTVLDAKSRDNISQSLERIALTIKNLENTTENLDNLLAVESSNISTILENTKSFTSSLKDNTDKLNNLVTNASAISDSLARIDFVSTMHEVEQSFSEVNVLLRQINEGQGSVGQLMASDSLYRQLDATIANLNSLLEEVKKNPKKYLKLSVF